MKLLFIGNSHTYYNAMPQIVQELLVATGGKAHVTMLAAGGKNLAYHATAQNTAFNIRFGGYDFVIAQEKAGGFDPISFRDSAKIIKDMADRAGCTSAFSSKPKERMVRPTVFTFARASSAFLSP